MGPNEPAGLLRGALRANAIFSLVCGAAFLAASHGLGSAFGLAPGALAMFGAVLLGFAVHLWRVGSRGRVSSGAGLYFLFCDLIYVGASAVVLFGFPGALTATGRLFFLIAAEMVAVFAAIEYLGLRRLKRRSQAEANSRAEAGSLV